MLTLSPSFPQFLSVTEAQVSVEQGGGGEEGDETEELVRMSWWLA